MEMGHKGTVALLCLAGVVAGGCGAAHGVTAHRATAHSVTTDSVTTDSVTTHSVTTHDVTTHDVTNQRVVTGPFAWLRPAPPPPSWPVAHFQGAAALAYPPSWRRIETDPGTVSAATVAPRSGLITQYLNGTPQQGAETPGNWASFRPAHNREDGDSDERVLAVGRNLSFRDGRGSCVIDRYRTSLTTYQEIACLVRGPAGVSAIVAAAQASRWAKSAPVLERAVSAFVA
jgi:hypothetical protein